MAIRFAIQAGNWSSASTWDGGLTIPAVGDEVYLNGYNVTINQDVTTGFITNAATSVGVPLSPIVNMTDNTTPNTVGQAFATQNNSTAWKVFRRNIDTFQPSTDGWQSTTQAGQIGFQFNSAKSIQRYAWVSNQGNNNRPRNWTFEGSNDNVTWVVLHTVTGATNQATYHSPSISNGSSYLYYRINITVTQGGAVSLINGFDLTESTSLGNGFGSEGTATISTSRNVTATFHQSSPVFTNNQTTLITVSATSPSIVNLTGDLSGIKAGSAVWGVSMTGNCTLNFVGNVVGGLVVPSLAQASNVRGISLSIGGTLNVTGDVSGARNGHSFSISTTVGVYANTNSIINIVGNVSSGLGTRSNVGVYNTATATINITGNITNAAGIDFSTANCGVYLGDGSTVCSIVGNVTTSTRGHAIYAGNNPVKVSGNLTNGTSGDMAFRGAILYLESANQWEFRKENLTTNTLYAPGVATGFPATNNVRTGVVYGPTNNLTGTCAVPPAAVVSLGVPVDNTVGTASLDANALAIALTASLTPALDASLSVSLDAALSVSLPPAIAPALDTLLSSSLDTALSASLPPAIAPILWDEDVTNITTPNSIGERLKNCATVATTGAQISSFNP